MRNLTLLLLLCAIPAFPQGKGKGKGKGDAPVSAHAEAAIGFSAADRRLILDHYGPRGAGLPPGLAKRSSLPPGLEKQLRRKGTLPPGLQAKVTAFPPELEARLGPLPAGYRRVLVDHRAMVVASTTNTILDIIDLVRRR